MHFMFSKLLKHSVNFIFPVTCSSCGVYIQDDSNRICPDCFKKIEFIKPLFCQKCGLPLHSGGAHCYNCLHPEGKIYYESLRGTCVFEGVIKDLVHSYKYSSKEYLSKTFGNMLTNYLQDYNDLQNVDLVVPVPLHWYKKFKRGYNQSELLAKEVSLFYKKPLVCDNVIRKKYTKQQVGLSRKDRLINVNDAFGLKRPDEFKNKTVLVIDDVSTTGETVNQCAKVLKSSGANKVYGLTLARDVY
ncbi:MAG: hypothetical protein A3J83_08165 [Elusimicrobia bacterium RIFOXYA2_FULL_40_6]|nr:MAG: hypothetical protein A3J83_08165 [Elusimicrobia bacterium RIFOXYA2_FULL_40_6]